LNVLKEKTNKAGVYLWYNVSTNKYYIGSEIDVYTRLSRYYQKSYLVNHKDLPIIRGLIKHTMENFILIILEFTDKETLHPSEQLYIDLFQPTY
jgi:group I intron endonuclease